MDHEYFINFTPENLKLYAAYIRHMVNEQDSKESDEDIIRAYSGDTYLKVLWEDEYNLVVISVDSGIEVINCLKKADITRSQTVEL
ncbi:MAG TPA: hypothetical protein VJ464_14875 [Blastocatellia bacterium]|nr:hypothetical protein [Blastocatellia bacterium]